MYKISCISSRSAFVIGDIERDVWGVLISSGKSQGWDEGKTNGIYGIDVLFPGR